jgi:hypothetical protein
MLLGLAPSVEFTSFRRRRLLFGDDGWLREFRFLAASSRRLAVGFLIFTQVVASGPDSLPFVIGAPLPIFAGFPTVGTRRFALEQRWQKANTVKPT